LAKYDNVLFLVSLNLVSEQEAFDQKERKLKEQELTIDAEKKTLAQHKNHHRTGKISTNQKRFLFFSLKKKVFNTRLAKKSSIKIYSLNKF
jgi:hypothetical protein